MDDEENVPRRLRRFLRKGEPIPEKLLPKHVDSREPWDQPAITAQAKSNIAISQKNSSIQNAEAAMQSHPKHRGKRFQEVQEKQSSGPAPMQKVLGLQQKSQFEEKLPRAGEKAVGMKKDEIQQALEEIKKLHEQTTHGDSIDQMAEHIAEQNQKKSNPAAQPLSFHFTPAGAAPNPVDAEKFSAEKDTKTPPTTPASNIPAQKLSPRERMEQRRMQRGQPPANASGTTLVSAAPSNASPAPGSHIRRRMGQVQAGNGNEADASNTSDAPENMSPAAEEDFKDLFADDKHAGADAKKKKKKPTPEDDEDADLDGDGELSEDEEDLELLGEDEK